MDKNLKTLIEFVIDTDYEDLPAEAIDSARNLTIDFVGEALAGSKTRTSRIVLDHFLQAGGAPEATVIAGGKKIPAASAALVNTTVAHSTELESVGVKTGPNTTMVHPVALALAENHGLSGKDVLEATVVGFEVQAAFNEACWAIPRRASVATVNGIFGATATAAKMLKLNADQMMTAFSMAASGAAGLMLQVGSMMHYLEFGLSSRHGLESAVLAKAGFTAQHDIIERPRGFAVSFCGEEGYDLNILSKNLGSPYRVTQMLIKRYSCCFRTHRAIDATLQLMRENHLSYDDVDSVAADMNLYDAELLRYSEPTSGEPARFSMNHAVASAILGDVTVKNYSDEFVNSAMAKDARAKVTVTTRLDWSPERTASRNPVTIKLKDGRELTRELDSPVMPNQEEFLVRHKQCAQLVMEPEQVERFTNIMLGLEEVKDISSVMDLVRL